MHHFTINSWVNSCVFLMHSYKVMYITFYEMTMCSNVDNIISVIDANHII